jgi:hypothetical protein
MTLKLVTGTTIYEQAEEDGCLYSYVVEETKDIKPTFLESRINRL